MQLNDTEIALITQIIFPFVVSAAVYLTKHFLAKLPAAKQAQVESIVSKAVTAVEQAQSLVPGAVKKEYAVNLINALMKSAGVKASATQIDTLIEAAVYQFNVNRPKTAVIPVVK